MGLWQFVGFLGELDECGNRPGIPCAAAVSTARSALIQWRSPADSPSRIRDASEIHTGDRRPGFRPSDLLRVASHCQHRANGGHPTQLAPIPGVLRRPECMLPQFMGIHGKCLTRRWFRNRLTPASSTITPPKSPPKPVTTAPGRRQNQKLERAQHRGRQPLELAGSCKVRNWAAYPCGRCRTWRFHPSRDETL